VDAARGAELSAAKLLADLQSQVGGAGWMSGLVAFFRSSC
jgi:hypothetical protein